MLALNLVVDVKGLSPRGRGKQAWERERRAWARSIPAWAGETLAATPTLQRAAVYPRVGGGNFLD